MELIRHRNHYPRSFRNFLDTFFTEEEFNGSIEKKFTPKTDVIENDNEYSISVALPGIDKKDINVEYKDSLLKITGERKLKEEKNVGKYHLVENFYGSFDRSFRIPKDGNKSKIDAKYENGVLNITIPKDEEKKIIAKIDVK